MKAPMDKAISADNDVINIVKEFCASAHGKGGTCIVRAECYDNRLSHFRELFEAARNDFPSLAETDVRVEKFSGMTHSGMFGLEFEVNMPAPKEYMRIPKLETLR